MSMVPLDTFPYPPFPPPFLFVHVLAAAFLKTMHISLWPAASSSSAQLLSLGLELLKCTLYSQVGSPQGLWTVVK